MIYLDDDKEYYILIDEQGAGFAHGVIYEGLKEVGEQFKSWADADDMEDAELKGWSIADCLSFWCFTIKEWTGDDFKEVSGEELEYTL